ncbi:MAG TPA: PIG-L family deacetylase, partial [Cyclobacteriaceae bacterium]|nr:PIG-L family deacetylase [Cyclobacteriaceae bacterium]
MKPLFVFLVLLLCVPAFAQNNNAIRVIMIGAHPDDCDQDSGGTAILLSQLGYAVKFVAVTNGDAGHQSEGGGMLA